MRGKPPVRAGVGVDMCGAWFGVVDVDRALNTPKYKTARVGQDESLSEAPPSLREPEALVHCALRKLTAEEAANCRQLVTGSLNCRRLAVTLQRLAVNRWRQSWTFPKKNTQPNPSTEAGAADMRIRNNRI